MTTEERYNLTEKDFQVGRYMRMTALSNALDAECKALSSISYGDPEREKLLDLIKDLHRFLSNEVYSEYKPISVTVNTAEVEDEIPF